MIRNRSIADITITCQASRTTGDKLIIPKDSPLNVQREIVKPGVRMIQR
jgi:hypothetical protein